MASAPKPWDVAQRVPVVSQFSSIRKEGPSLTPNTSFSGLVDGVQTPAVPPRHNRDGTYSSYSGYGNYPGSYNTGYGSLYSPYGMYGMPGRTGFNAGPYAGVGFQNGLMHQVQESTRSAFQPIENVLNAFSSISMMLDSSYTALVNSFNAVLGVADHFGRLKVHLAQVFSSLAAFRILRWLYKRLLVMLRLKAAMPSEESWSHAWRGEAMASVSGGMSSQQHISRWPLVLFSAVVIGGPWLMWKMMHSMVKAKDHWLSSDEPVIGQALYHFQAEGPEELSLVQGQQVTLAPLDCQPRLQHNDWLIASVDGVKTGWVPANYVRILGKKSKKKASSGGQAGDHLFRSDDGS